MPFFPGHDLSIVIFFHLALILQLGTYMICCTILKSSQSIMHHSNELTWTSFMSSAMCGSKAVDDISKELPIHYAKKQ
jgi:hypothetical protein